jgi:hypothetical protein
MTLTFSEQNVFFALLDNPNQAEAARRCYMSKRSYEKALQNLREKHGCKNNIALVAKYMRKTAQLTS